MSILTKPQLLFNYTVKFPQIKRMLNQWYQMANDLPDELKKQAQSSIKSKSFHCIGGSIYALYPQVNQEVMLTAIIALQTISDYLDNLCDRIDINNQQTFRQLHFSFLDALDPDKPMRDYYKYYPYSESIYLCSLVATCRNQIKVMPYYPKYKSNVMQLAEYYCQLQINKHLVPQGEKCLKEWISSSFHFSSYDQLKWNELAAACGSTLGIFALFALSYHDYSGTTIDKIFNIYFPWVQGIHILLDYFIDAREDKEHNELNFTFYYNNIGESIKRMHFIYAESINRVGQLPHPIFHELILQGLIAMYGTDPKLKQEKLLPSYQIMLDSTSTKILYNICILLRKLKYLS